MDIMAKVRIEFYCDLQTFMRIDSLRQEKGHKGFTTTVNEICMKYFKNISSQDKAVDSLNAVIQRYVDEIDGLKQEVLQLKGVKK